SPIGPKTRPPSPGWRAAKAPLYEESERRTAYSRCGRVGLDARDMGRASIPSLVFSCRKVNWVGRKTNAFGFSIRISWDEGVSGREETTGMRNPLGGSAMRRPLARSRWAHERGIS